LKQNDYIERLSGFFERLGGWSYDHRWTVVGFCLLLVGASFFLASKTRYDNSFEAYFDHDDPSYIAYLQYREDFGSDEVSYILYEAPSYPHGPWNLEVMGKVARLTEALEEEVPFVQEVTSLVNLEFLEGVPDGLEIYDRPSSWRWTGPASIPWRRSRSIRMGETAWRISIHRRAMPRSRRSWRVPSTGESSFTTPATSPSTRS
jgi:hypothetical protein